MIRNTVNPLPVILASLALGVMLALAAFTLTQARPTARVQQTQDGQTQTVYLYNSNNNVIISQYQGGEALADE